MIEFLIFRIENVPCKAVQTSMTEYGIGNIYSCMSATSIQFFKSRKGCAQQEGNDDGNSIG